MGSAHPPEPRRRPRRHARVPAGDGRSTVGEDPHDRLGRRAARRAQAGRLRRGQGGRDGLLARARGGSRPARRDGELPVPRDDEARPARRRDRTPARARAAPRQGVPDGPSRARHRPCPARGAPVQRRRRVDHRAGVPGRRRLLPGALTRRPRKLGLLLRRSAKPPPPRLFDFLGLLRRLSIQLSLVRPVLLSGPMAAPARTRRRKPPSKRGRTSRRRAPARPSAWERTREAAGHQLRGHGADTLAVALVVVGVLTVLGLASDLAGSVGSFLADGSATMLGRGRIAFPLACFGFAGLLFAGYLPSRADADAVEAEPSDDDDADAKSPAPLRIGLGIVLVMLATVGLLHLAGGSPPVDASDQLRNAGGLLGAAMAAPLASVAGVVGTAVILTGIGLLGLLLAPGVPMRRVFDAIGAGLRWVAHAVGVLFQLGGDHQASDVAEDELEPEADDEPGEDLDDTARELEPEPFGELAEADPEPPTPAMVSTTVEPGGQVAIDLGLGYRPGSWKLPPANVLKRGTKPEIDRR